MSLPTSLKEGIKKSWVCWLNCVYSKLKKPFGLEPKCLQNSKNPSRFLNLTPSFLLLVKKGKHAEEEENTFTMPPWPEGSTVQGGNHGGGTERMQTSSALIHKHMPEKEEEQEVKYYFICVKVRTAGFVPQRSRFADTATPTITHLAS